MINHHDPHETTTTKYGGECFALHGCGAHGGEHWKSRVCFCNVAILPCTLKLTGKEWHIKVETSVETTAIVAALFFVSLLLLMMLLLLLWMALLAPPQDWYIRLVAIILLSSLLFLAFAGTVGVECGIRKRWVGSARQYVGSIQYVVTATK
jgi:hypothetical protein